MQFIDMFLLLFTNSLYKPQCHDSNHTKAPWNPTRNLFMFLSPKDNSTSSVDAKYSVDISEWMRELDDASPHQAWYLQFLVVRKIV